MPVQPRLHGHAVIFYLHGFASSARSSKATFFASKLRELGLEFETPDFNEPDFSTLTITRMVDQVIAGIDARPGEPITLIGSSLGGFVAVQVALQRPARVSRLILLAPALDLSWSRFASEVGSRTLDEWRRTGRMDVFHYGYSRMTSLHYGLYEDARQYDCLAASLTMPIQIFQGRRDTAVNPASVERWAKARPNAELHMLDDDHQLIASLPYVWEETFGRKKEEG